MSILDYILGLVLASLIMVSVHDYEINAFETKASDLMTREAASEQVQFAAAVGHYLDTASLTEGATISVQTLKSAGLLPAGFPASNPFGQTPLAYIGNNRVALATYTGLPNSTRMEAIGYNIASTISMNGLMAKLILRASSDQVSLAYMLVAVQVLGGTASSPFTGRSVNLSSYFTGQPTPTAPIFGELINMDSAYSGVEGQ